MNCNKVDIIGYTEGTASSEDRTHIEGCAKCKAKVMKLGGLTARYVQGAKIHGDLMGSLERINISKMKKLPDPIAERARALRERNILSRVKKVFGKRAHDKASMEGLLGPRTAAMPASPKDLTKPRPKKKKKTN